MKCPLWSSVHISCRELQGVHMAGIEATSRIYLWLLQIAADYLGTALCQAPGSYLAYALGTVFPGWLRH